MDSVVLDSASKVFRHRPALFNWIGRERGGETRALDGVSLGVRSGEVLALLGPNGSGKTTTLKLISTVLLPDSGSVFVNGWETLTDANAVRRQVGLAVAAERSFLPRLSARENLDFFAAMDDVPRNRRQLRIDATLQQIGLAHAADTLVMKFSSGMYQRLATARALMKEPSVLLLDEPTRSLDAGSAVQFWELIRKLAAQGKTIILATHSFHEAAAVADSVAVLYQGRLAGYRKLGWAQAHELRSYYFHTTGELEQPEPLLVASR